MTVANIAAAVAAAINEGFTYGEFNKDRVVSKASLAAVATREAVGLPSALVQQLQALPIEGSVSASRLMMGLRGLDFRLGIGWRCDQGSVRVET